MAKVKTLQTNFTSGAIDMKLEAREDIVFYYNGLYDARNLLVIPQGGVTRRNGGQFVREVTPVLAPIEISGYTFTAPNGGTAANAKDGDPATLLTTGNLSSTNPFVLLHIDALVAVAVTAIDVIDYRLGSLALSNEIRWQSSTDNAAWTDYGATFDWDAAKRSRRSRNEAGPVTARYWRLVRIGTTDIAAAANIGEVKFWSQTSTLSAGRLFPFSYETKESYMMAVSDRNIDVLDGADYAGSISIPHTSAQMSKLNYAQTLDSMWLFHGAVQTWKIFRQGDSDEFDFRYFDYVNIPKYDYGAGVGGVNETQVLNDGGLFNSGDKITILLEGERTTTITGGGTRAASATAIQAALVALSNVDATTITVTDAGGVGFTVVFSDNNGKREWGEMSVSVQSGTSVWTTSRTVKGEDPGEAIMSATRGWPRCGVIHQGSLNVAGIPGVPDAWLKSVIGDYANFDINRDDAERALMVRAESDQVHPIFNIAVGQHLSFFTGDGEAYVPSEKIDINSVIKQTTNCGSKEGIRPMLVEGAFIFVQGVEDKNNRGEQRATSLQEFIYDEAVQRYRSALISKLSSHLIKNPVDGALRKLSSTDESNLILLPNEDGTATAYTILREDEVNALMPIGTWPRTQDKYIAVGVDKKQRVFWMVDRVINGVTRRFIEMWNERLFFDCGGIVDITAETFTATAEQDEFVWTFDNPGDADAIGVRLNGGRLTPDLYDVDLGTKTVTLAAELAATVIAGDKVRVAKMVKEVTGLGHLTGETVQTFIDGTEGADYPIEDGVLTLDEYADTEIQYGFDFEVYGKLMPFAIPQSETLADDKVRVVKVIANVYETSGIEIRANGSKKWQEIRLVKMDDNVLDRSTMELLATGKFRKEGLLGYAVGGPVEFRQPGPGPFTLLGITREVSL